MTDVAAVPATAEQVPQIIIFFGGWFDQIILGAPMYFWFIFFLGIGLFCLGILAIYYRYWVLDKIWAFVECYKSHKPLALIRTRYRKAYFKSLKYIAQIFTDEESPDKWYAPALETAQSIAGVNLIDAVDYYDWLQDPILNETIVEIVQEWNDDHPNDADKIHDPIKFQELLGSGQLKDYFDKTEVTTYYKGNVAVKAFFVVDISKVEQYLPRTRSSSAFSGLVEYLANDLNQGGKLDWKAYVLPVMAMCTAIIICAIIGWLIIHA